MAPRKRKTAGAKKDTPINRELKRSLARLKAHKSRVTAAEKKFIDLKIKEVTQLIAHIKALCAGSLKFAFRPFSIKGK